LCELQKSLPRSRARSASSPSARPLASCELLFCRARRATGHVRRSPHWNNSVDGWMDENFWKLFFTKRVPLCSKSLELGKWQLSGFWMRIFGRLFPIKPPLWSILGWLN
jgi:hypothetical protein